MKRFNGKWPAILIVALAACAVAWSTTVAAAPPKPGGTLKFIPHADLKIIDPIWTTAYISRNHGYMIYDVLFALDDNLEIQPQMVNTWEVSDDALQYTFTLRDGLSWHDGQPVTSDDVVASLRRWGQKDGQGQLLMAFTESLEALDAKTFRLTLKEPFGLVLDALAKPSSNVPFIMPARVAATPADEQIQDTTGSGPFIFVADEWRPGHQVVYRRNDAYVPRGRGAQFCGRRQARLRRTRRVALSARRRHRQRRPAAGRGGLLGVCAAGLRACAGRHARHQASRSPTCSAPRRGCAPIICTRRSTTRRRARR